MIIQIGRPTHLATTHLGWAACGVQTQDVTEDRIAVNCLRCIRTKAYKKASKQTEDSTVNVFRSSQPKTTINTRTLAARRAYVLGQLLEADTSKAKADS